ncbi:MAG: 4-hydroxy-tetrahydrodipicolinate synthase [Sphingobacteriia bacterium]
MGKGLFDGLGVAMVTPMLADGQLDTEGLRRLTEHLIDGGVDYLVPLGTTGESSTLTKAEKHYVLDIVVEVNAGRKPMLLGCGGNDTAAVVQEIQSLDARYQPDGFLSVSPAYNKPSQAGILAHYQAIAAATERPIVLYNVPPRTASNLEPGTVLALAETCPTIIAIKEASGSLPQAMELVAHKPAHFSVLRGDDLLALPGICLGLTGLISVLGNALPELTGRMVHLAARQEVQAARALHYQLLPLIHAIFQEGNPAGIKALLAELGICQPYTRLPLVPASHDLQARLGQLLKALKQAS